MYRPKRGVYFQMSDILTFLDAYSVSKLTSSRAVETLTLDIFSFLIVTIHYYKMSLQELTRNVWRRTNIFESIDILEKKVLNNPEMLQELDEEAMTSLFRAAENFRLNKVMKVIFEFGVNSINSLELALYQGNLQMAEQSLKNGEFFEDTKWSDYHPGKYIFKKENIESRKDMVLLLIEYGLVGFRNSKGYNLLHLLACEATEIDHDAVEIAKILLNSGISINEPNYEDWTPLLFSLCGENLSLTKFLIENGADVNQKDKHSRQSALHFSAQLENINIIELLLKHGADINAQDQHGWTALHDACMNESATAVSFLISKGSDISVESCHSEIPLSLIQDDECMIAMMKEFARLNFENRFIREKDMNIVRKNLKAQKYFEKCKAELYKMANTNFYGSHSYYSVLKTSKEIKKLSRSTKNKEFVGNFEASLSNFSYYKNDLQSIFKEAVQIKDRMELVEKRLCNIFGGVLPAVVIRILGENLSVEDLLVE